MIRPLKVPREYRYEECPGPVCKSGVAKYCVYEVEGEDEWIMEVIRLCRSCRKTHHVREGKIRRGATIDIPKQPTTGAGSFRPSRPRNTVSGFGVNSR